MIHRKENVDKYGELGPYCFVSVLLFHISIRKKQFPKKQKTGQTVNTQEHDNR